MPGCILLLSTLLLVSFGVDVEGVYPTTKTTTKQYETTKTTGYRTRPTPPGFKCKTPNETLVYGCPPEKICPDRTIAHTCEPPYPARCVCAKGYVLDPLGGKCISEKDCQCPGPNEEYNTCDGCDGNCTVPEPKCTKFCGYFSGGCFCKPGFVRNEAGVCINKHSCDECKVETSSTIIPITTTEKGITCLDGSDIFSDCYFAKNQTKCLEDKEKREKDVFKPILCPQGEGYTQCYSIRHSCGIADGEYRVKGCARTNGTEGPSFPTTCHLKRHELCRTGDSNTFKCGICQGDLCNKTPFDRFSYVPIIGF